MPNNSSRADTVLDAEELVAAVEANAELLPDIDRHKTPVVETLSEVKGLSVQQQALTADRQRLTQQLKTSIRRLKDLTMHLRAAVRADIGLRSEKLVHFKLKPLRPRQRRPRPTDPEPEPPTEV